MLALFAVGLLFAANQHGKPRAGKYNFWGAVIGIAIQFGILFAGGFFSPCAHAQVPHESARYKLTLLREAHSQWGLGAPVPAWLVRFMKAGKKAVDAAGDKISPEENENG